jgi:hypothetical protein
LGSQLEIFEKPFGFFPSATDIFELQGIDDSEDTTACAI